MRSILPFAFTSLLVASFECGTVSVWDEAVGWRREGAQRSRVSPLGSIPDEVVTMCRRETVP